MVVGEWPFCGGANNHGFASEGISVIDDQLEGGARLFDTMGHEPVWIESKSQWKREVAQRGLVNVDKYDRAHYARKFREHDERLRDTGKLDNEQRRDHEADRARWNRQEYMESKER